MGLKCKEWPFSLKLFQSARRTNLPGYLSGPNGEYSTLRVLVNPAMPTLSVLPHLRLDNGQRLYRLISERLSLSGKAERRVFFCPGARKG